MRRFPQLVTTTVDEFYPQERFLFFISFEFAFIGPINYLVYSYVCIVLMIAKCVGALKRVFRFLDTKINDIHDHKESLMIED